MALNSCLMFQSLVFSHESQFRSTTKNEHLRPWRFLIAVPVMRTAYILQPPRFPGLPDFNLSHTESFPEKVKSGILWHVQSSDLRRGCRMLFKMVNSDVTRLHTSVKFTWFHSKEKKTCDVRLNGRRAWCLKVMKSSLQSQDEKSIVDV